jgi:peptidoglycan hydrolase CwlO-like protein
MSPEKLFDFLLLLLNGAVAGLVIIVFRLLSKTSAIEAQNGVIMQKLTDNCEAFQRQINALNHEKDRILVDADKEHERIENLVVVLGHRVDDYQSKFHIRSEDIVRINGKLDQLDSKLELLNDEVGLLRTEVRGGRG